MNDSRHQVSVLHGATAVLPDRILNTATIQVEGGRIAKIADDIQAHENALDLHGLTLCSGMIDVHIHGAVGVDTMTANADDLDRVSRFLATRGVTGWLPTLVPAPDADYQKAVGAIEGLMKAQSRQELPSGARVLGVHYEGPFVNSAQCGALHAEHFKTFSSVADIDALPTPEVPGALRMMTLAPEVPGALDLTREIVGRGWIVSLGHTRATVEQLDEAFNAGARHITHFMNAMSPFHHRSPGPVGWGLTKAEVTFDVIADGIHLDPLVLKLLLQAKGPGGMMLISDAIAAAGAGDGDYEIWGEMISVKAGRTSNAKGSIAGSVITMFDAARMIRSLGVSEIEVAQMASTNPARLLGLGRERGAIEVGNYADLVALDQLGNIRFTMVDGHMLSREED